MAVGASIFSSAAAGGTTTVAASIAQAARATGASFQYLLATARVESGFNPSLAAKTSSAHGLFQFIEQTWLGTLKQSGAQYGYGHYSDAIARSATGRYTVADPALRREILDLRKDPAANAVMAGVFTRQNASILASRLGRKASEGDLYVAHFLGVGGAAKLIRLAAGNPQASAVDAFPHAARANRPIFYDRQGQPRNVSGVYAELVRRYDVARAAPSLAAPATELAAVHAPVPKPKPEISAVRDTAGVTTAYAAAAPKSALETAPARRTTGEPTPLRAIETVNARGRSEDSEPIFRALYRPQGAPSPVAQIVSELWGVAARARDAVLQLMTVPASLPQADDNAPVGAPLELFKNMRPDVRAIFDRSA